MNIQAEKIELVKMLLDTENPRIIEEKLKAFLAPSVRASVSTEEGRANE